MMSLFRPGVRFLQVVLGSGACVALATAAVHCQAAAEESTFVDPNGEGGAGREGGTNPFGGCDGAACTPADTGPPLPTCGDGRVAETESCDDGNAKAGDGCDAKCAVEPGWACPTPGLRCQASKCGDGIIAGAEECDYKPGLPVTGCSATTCRIEPNYDCDPKTLTCNVVSCGDGKVQRGETCEDGNALPFDGCFKCQKEPSCVNGVCKASCGDGQRFAGEACDDGNTREGDGCSATCTIETGFKCTDILLTPPDTINQPVLVRDFIGVGRENGGSTGHLDFNGLGGSGLLGMVASTLSLAGKPVLACPLGDCAMNPGRLYTNGRGPHITTDANWLSWFTNTLNVNIASTVTVPLQRSGGTYVWDSADPLVNGGKSYFDPINTGGWVAAGKETLAPCGAANVPDRNVSFTSETHFWFEYQGGEQFAFAGDDDTWVFVNRKLAIDLGGLHEAKKGSFVLDADTDGAGADTADGTAAFTSDLQAPGSVNLGLVKGGTYEVVMFQAERNECGSNFKVTLKDFNRPKSACVSTCGDGVVASDEVCDDGKNNGSYGGCMPGCKARGPFCGDGKLDATEDCDDGNTNNSDSCSNTCRVVVVK